MSSSVGISIPRYDTVRFLWENLWFPLHWSPQPNQGCFPGWAEGRVDDVDGICWKVWKSHMSNQLWESRVNTFYVLYTFLVGGLEHFLFSHILGIIIPIDHYFWDGLNPQTSFPLSRLFTLGGNLYNHGGWMDAPTNHHPIILGRSQASSSLAFW